jgi:hypothetical protein
MSRLQASTTQRYGVGRAALADPALFHAQPARVYAGSVSLMRHALATGSTLLLVGCAAGGVDVAGGGPTTQHSIAAAASPSPSGSPATDADDAVVRALRAFAAEPSTANFDRVPWADRVAIGVGTDLLRTVPAAELRSREAWTVRPTSGYEWASSGPFNALDLLDDDEPYQTSVGPHPHCASKPKDPPADVPSMRRVSTQPSETTCLSWYTVDLFMQDGEIHAVTLDLWEP